MKNLEIQKQARKRIPGGTQLLSKRPEMFAPEQWPGYYSKAKGVETWDLEGNKYIDMSISGIGANILGFADDDVDNAVKAAIDKGTNCSLNCPEEVELADLLCNIHPWADMVRYARCGGEAMAIAVRIARAYTKKEKIAFCGYHGWHDWYLAANLSENDNLQTYLLSGLLPLGVPKGLTGTIIPFYYNKINEFKETVSKNSNELAAIIMEPLRDSYPCAGFLSEIRDIANKIGAVLIFDEITAAMRLSSGGAHLLFDVNPDIAVFAKGMSNGYPMAAIIGKEKIMQVAQETFISSTYWTERIGPVAALATILKHKELNVAEHLVKTGELVQKGWKTAAEKNNLNLHISGIFPLSHFYFEYENGLAMMTLFTQMMLERGFLASGRFYATYAHKKEHIEAYIKEVEQVFLLISKAIKNKKVEQLLKGPVAHSGFQRLT